jgi:TonB-linked SusC/RagA family outer membrane protein
MKRNTTWLMALAAGAAPSALVAQATTGTITGRITDRGSGQPLVAAQVQVVGTNRGTTTSEAGTFRITGVPVGSQQIRVLRIGYQAQTAPVQVVAGQAATVTVSLQAATTTLDVVTVTATGTQQRAREQGSNIAVVPVDSQPLAAVTNFSNLVAGRAAGVTVVQSSGTTGTGARVRIRGANSVNLSNEPLLIIDGVRIDPNANSGTIDVGGQTISRLNDLKPEDIETFEVLKGPAATGLYGTAAANGVIQVTTRRGRAGRTQYNVFGDVGTVENFVTFPGNYTAYGRNPTTGALLTSRNGPVAGNSGTLCTLQQVAASQCAVDSVTARQPLNVAGVSPYRDGRRNRLGGSVRGGNELARYFLSADVEGERGVFTTSNLNRRNFRANVDATPAQGFNVGLSAGYLSSRVQLPQNDNNNLGLTAVGLIGGSVICSAATPCRQFTAAGAPVPNAAVDTTSNGYQSGLNVGQLNALETFQNVERFTGALNTNYSPFTWLTLTGTAGLDVNNRDDQQLLPPGFINTTQNNLLGTRTRNRYQVGTYTMNASAQASFTPVRGLTSQTTAGVQYQRDNTYGTEAFGARLLAGTGSLEGTATQFAVGEQNVYTRLFGVLVQEQIGYGDRLFLTAAIRGDRNAAFGENLGFVTYPSAQLSYVPSEESFFPRNPVVTSLKLRAAFGQSGLRPGVFDALRYFSPVAATVQGASQPAFTAFNAANNVVGGAPGGVGLPNLRPERVNEVEGGFDFGFFNGRATLEATYFAKMSRDALIQVPLVGSAGGPTQQLQNIGRVTNKGLELSSTLRFLNTPAIGAEMNVNFSTLENKLVSLREGITPIIYGLGGSTQRHTPGSPLGAYYQTKYTFADANSNRIIEQSEVKPDTAGQSYIGNPLPRRTLSVQPTITLFRNVRVQGLVDYRGGFFLYNSTEQFRCTTTSTCRAIFDPSTPLDRQAAAVASRAFGTFAGYMEKADFTKLREVSVTLQLPQSYAQRYLRARGASLSLAGRNLAVWTKYRGLDPEVSYAGQSNQTYADFFTQPPVRYYVARFNLDF